MDCFNVRKLSKKGSIAPFFYSFSIVGACFLDAFLQFKKRTFQNIEYTQVVLKHGLLIVDLLNVEYFRYIINPYFLKIEP